MRTRLSRFVVRVSIVMTLTGCALMASSSAAQAYDAYPCGKRFWRVPPNFWVQYCPDWGPGNRIPVYKDRDSPGRGTVGEIYAPGDDWYYCQQHGAPLGLIYNGSHYTNNVWASTRADNGAYGWVNQIYFQGGSNNEADRGLVWCATS